MGAAQASFMYSRFQRADYFHTIASYDFIMGRSLSNLDMSIPTWYCNRSFWETDVKLDFFDKSVKQISSPPKEVAAYLAIVHPFGVYVWICILLSTCTVPLVFIIMDHTYFYAFQTHRTEYVFEGNSVIHSDFLSLISKVKKGPHWKKASRHQMLSNIILTPGPHTSVPQFSAFDN